MSENQGQSPPQQGEDKENLLPSQEHIYNPLASPPDLTKALKHQRARRVGRSDMAESKEHEAEYCECCGLSTKNHPLPVCSSRLDLAEFGAGFPLYFEYVFFCGLLLGLLFVIVGIYNLIVNGEGVVCDIFAYSTEYPCKGGFIIEKSLGNREDLDTYKIASILNLVFVIVGLLVAFYYRRVQSMTADEVDRGSITTSDYTVIVSGIPTTESAETIKKFFEEKGRQAGSKTVVKKVNMAYEIGTYVELIRRKAKLAEKIAKGDTTTKTQEQLKQTEDKLKVFEDAVDNNSSTKFTGIAFVTFNTEKETLGVLEKFKMSPFERHVYNFFKSFLSVIGIRFEKTFNGKIIDLNRAPDPLDVFWENLGYDFWKAIRIRLVSFLSTFILIGMSFGMILGISFWQENTKKNSSNGSLITFLAFLGSYFVTIINGFIGFFMRKLAGLEKHTTYTYYFISIATKLTYAQFINTALITLFVQLARSEPIHLWVEDSIVSKVFFLSLLNAFVPSLMYIFNPWYLLRVWKRSKMISQGSQSKLTQQEANALFEGPQIDIAQRYANIQKTMLFTGFYATLLPIGIVFSFVGLFVTYWTDKYMLLRRHCRPNTLGKELAEQMSDFLELFFVSFAAGNMVFEKIAIDKISGVNIAALVIAAIFYVLPQKYLSRCIRKREHGVYNTREYDEVRYHFSTEYDRANPITQEDAMKEFFMAMSKLSGPQAKEEEGKSLSSYFQHMPKQNQLNTLANYAQYNPSFRQVQQQNNNFTFAPPRPIIQQPVFGFSPVQNQSRPMQIVPQPQSGAFAQPIRFVNQQFNTVMNGMQQMIPLNRYGFGYQNQQVARPIIVNHIPQQNNRAQVIQMAPMNQPRPLVVNQFPQQNNNPQPPVANHFPQQNNNTVKPPVANHFPQAQPQVQSQPQQLQQPQQQLYPQIQPQSQPQAQLYPQIQPQPQMQRPSQPQVMAVNQPQMIQVNQQPPQMNRPPSSIPMTQQYQPNQPFAGQPHFGFQQQQQPQTQFGMRPPQMMQQPPMMQMNMGQPNNFAPQYNQPISYAPPIQQMQGNTVFGGQPGFGWKGGR